MEPNEKQAGFSKNKGLKALFCYFGFFITAFFGLRKRSAFLIAFLVLTTIFHTLFAKNSVRYVQKFARVIPQGISGVPILKKWNNVPATVGRNDGLSKISRSYGYNIFLIFPSRVKKIIAFKKIVDNGPKM